jgi:hypothetical protein
MMTVRTKDAANCLGSRFNIAGIDENWIPSGEGAAQSAGPPNAADSKCSGD